MNGVAMTTSSEVEKLAHTSSGMRQNDMPGARMVMIVTRKLSAVAIDDAPANCTPMEKNIWGVKKTDKPGIFLRQFGKGRVVYFPWDIDRVYWEVMVDDHGRLLRNAIDWALDEERPVTVNGPGVLDVTVWKQKNSMTVHLVNLTNPMMMKGPVREVIPSPPQTVRIRMPEGRRVKAVKRQVTEAWHAASSFPLTIEPEIFWRRGRPPKQPDVHAPGGR